MKLYSKSTCITCKKAIAFLNQKGQTYTLLDIISQPPDKALLTRWLKSAEKAGTLKTCINTRSTAYKTQLANQPMPTVEVLVAQMLDDPNLIKRPLVVTDSGDVLCGFDESDFQRICAP